MSKKIAIVVGHSPNEKGAYSETLGQSEYEYNKYLAAYLSDIADIYFRPNVSGYKSAMRALARELNPKPYQIVIELHFNAFNGKASGTEALIWKGNNRSRAIGEKLNKAVSGQYKTKNRGVKEVSDQNGRGYWFLQSMSADAVIFEPFFGDAPEEAEKFKDPEKLAQVIKLALGEYCLT